MELRVCSDLTPIAWPNGIVPLINQGGGVSFSERNNRPWRFPPTGRTLPVLRPSWKPIPLAWSASDSIGGSPARIDPLTVDPQRNIVINELLAHTDAPRWISNSTITPDDRYLRMFADDDPATNKFCCPPGRAFRARLFGFRQPVAALKAAGQTIPQRLGIIACSTRCVMKAQQSRFRMCSRSGGSYLIFAR